MYLLVRNSISPIIFVLVLPFPFSFFSTAISKFLIFRLSDEEPFPIYASLIVVYQITLKEYAYSPLHSNVNVFKLM